MRVLVFVCVCVQHVKVNLTNNEDSEVSARLVRKSPRGYRAINDYHPFSLPVSPQPLSLFLTPALAMLLFKAVYVFFSFWSNEYTGSGNDKETAL